MHDDSMDKDTRDVITRVLEAMGEGKRRVSLSSSHTGQTHERERRNSSMSIGLASIPNSIAEASTISSQLSFASQLSEYEGHDVFPRQ